MMFDENRMTNPTRSPSPQTTPRLRVRPPAPHLATECNLFLSGRPAAPEAPQACHPRQMRPNASGCNMQQFNSSLATSVGCCGSSQMQRPAASQRLDRRPRDVAQAGRKFSRFRAPVPESTGGCNRENRGRRPMTERFEITWNVLSARESAGPVFSVLSMMIPNFTFHIPRQPSAKAAHETKQHDVEQLDSVRQPGRSRSQL